MVKKYIKICILIMIFSLMFCSISIKSYANEEIRWKKTDWGDTDFNEDIYSKTYNIDKLLNKYEGIPRYQDESGDQRSARGEAVTYMKEIYDEEFEKHPKFYFKDSHMETYSDGVTTYKQLYSTRPTTKNKDGTYNVEGNPVEVINGRYYATIGGVKKEVFKYNPLLDDIKIINDADVDANNKSLVKIVNEDLSNGIKEGLIDSPMEIKELPIFKQPDIAKKDSKDETIDKAIEGAEEFIKTEDKHVSAEKLQDFSDVFYNIWFEIGVVATVVVGAVIGVKFMFASAEEKADIQGILIPYVFGCIIIFSSFGIWKIAIKVFSNL